MRRWMRPATLPALLLLVTVVGAATLATVPLREERGREPTGPAGTDAAPGWQGPGALCPDADTTRALLDCLATTVRRGGYQAPEGLDALVWHHLAEAAHDGDCPVGAFPDGRPRAWWFVDGDFRLCVIADVDTGRDGLQDHGWGFLMVRDGADGPHVQVPHPVHDRQTFAMGAAMFDAGAGSLAVAGAHRHAGPQADVAHAPDSMFQALHLAVPGGVVVQLHGMAASSCPGVDVFVTQGGRGPAAGAAGDLLDALREVAPEWEVAGPSESRCHLAGGSNAQGAALPRGVAFVHVEAAPAARDPAVWASLA